MKIPKNLPGIPKRLPDTNKGDYGKILIIAGSYGMAGAAYLCAQGAQRSGAGLVYLCVPRGIYGILASSVICGVFHPEAETSSGS